MQQFCVNASSLGLLAAVFCSGCIAEEADLEREGSGTVEAAHVSHNNGEVGNGDYHPTYAVEYYGSDNRWWSKHNVTEGRYGVELTSPQVTSKDAIRVCHQQGVWWSPICMGAHRASLDPSSVAKLRLGPYWNTFSDNGIANLLSGHSVINNHYSHPDTLGFDANNAYLVRFDIAGRASIRSRSWYNLIVELDVSIPNQQACTTASRDLIPYVQMEAYWYSCRSPTAADGCKNSFIGASNSSRDSSGVDGRVGGVWNAATQTCAVRANVRIDPDYSNPIQNPPYSYFFKVAAVGGLGHLPAPVKVRIL
jgi:hypothetical protein